MRRIFIVLTMLFVVGCASHAPNLDGSEPNETETCEKYFKKARLDAQTALSFYQDEFYKGAAVYYREAGIHYAYAITSCDTVWDQVKAQKHAAISLYNARVSMRKELESNVVEYSTDSRPE